jgi:hypothetical protein
MKPVNMSVATHELQGTGLGTSPTNKDLHLALGILALPDRSPSDIVLALPTVQAAMLGKTLLDAALHADPSLESTVSNFPTVKNINR